MQRFLVFLSVVFVFISVPSLVFAQFKKGQENYSRQEMSIHRNMEVAERYYNEALQKLESGSRFGSDNSYIASMHSFYPQTSAYDADSGKLVDQLMQYAFLYDTEEDPVKKSQALVNYNTFVKEHLMDINVLFMAYSLSQQDASFGNVAYYNKIIDILETIIVPEFKKGETPADAFRASNFGEPTFVMQSLGVEPLKEESYEVSPGEHYRVYDVKNTKTGEEYPLFFDISIPMKAMADKAALEKGKNPIVPKL
ncbi:MAG: hypothetical protein OEY94_01470 [Alphaproteobacteria bacterium]|nr:hypothetical protein [Alphaproteobacteria bacterium]